MPDPPLLTPGRHLRHMLRQLTRRKQGVAKGALIRFGAGLEDSDSDLAKVLSKSEGLIS